MDRKRHAIIGAGGVFTAEDAYAKVRLGASLVQVLTALVYEGPGVVRRINAGLAALLARDGFASRDRSGSGWMRCRAALVAAPGCMILTGRHKGAPDRHLVDALTRGRPQGAPRQDGLWGNRMDMRVGKPPAKRSGTRDSTRTRAAILDAATREFTAKGLSGARVDAIAERAGVNKRMIYHYFGDKEGLYLAVLEETYAAIRTAEIDLNLERLASRRRHSQAGRLHLAAISSTTRNS